MAKVSFPKIGEKHRMAPLFDAIYAMKGHPRIPKKAIFIYSNTLERRLKKTLKLERSRHRIGWGGAWKANNLVTRDKKLILVKLPLGAPITAIAIEEAIACGAKEFLILGTAGAISPKLSISDLVVCNKAIRDEGTSHHYIKNSKYAFPSKSLTLKLKNRLTGNKMHFYEGASWTIDAGYAETKEEVRHYRNEGVFTVEMEAAALFAVAVKRGVNAAAVFTISDLLGEEWSGFIHEYRRSGYDKLADIAEIFKELD